MDQSIRMITLGVRDLAAARRFYVDGLGWTPTFEVEGEVVFLPAGRDFLVALFGADDLAADAEGAGTRAVIPAGASPRFSLAHNVESEAEVDAVEAQMVAAGGTVIKPAQRAEFGGYHAYVDDPDGFRWEIAHNPGMSVDADGNVTIGPIDG
jgi:catechol 2,3-dioxygenase-like lactoylglutathione lyase family enzyme